MSYDKEKDEFLAFFHESIVILIPTAFHWVQNTDDWINAVLQC